MERSAKHNGAWNQVHNLYWLRIQIGAEYLFSHTRNKYLLKFGVVDENKDSPMTISLASTQAQVFNSQKDTSL